jgi:Tfp pilus assembly protein PilF
VHLHEVVRRQPNNGSEYFELALMYEKKGQYDLALANFEQSLNLGTDLGQEFRMALQSKIDQLKRAR